jgi:replicative DNA helicase
MAASIRVLDFLGMGKSTLALSSLLRTALKGHGVMFFALEMGKQELSEMALASLAYRTGTRVEYRDISMANVGRDGFVQHFEAVSEVAPTFNSMPFFIDDRQGLTVAEVRSQAAQYAQRLASEGKRMDVVCIDHMGLLRASQSFGGNKVAQTEEVSNDLKRLAKELDCAVVALAQLNRSVEGRDDKRPGMADLRWSGAIEQDADVIMFPYRPEYYLRRQEEDGDKEMERQRKLTAARNKLELIIEKHRGGPTGAVELFCDVGCAVVKDLVV